MASDGTRRDPARARFWREQVQGQAASGVSVGAYCRRHRLRPSAFYYWRRALAKRGQAARAAFVPVTVADERGGCGTAMPTQTDESRGGRIEIVVSNGRRVQVTGPVDRQALADVLTVVEGRPC